MLLYRVLSAIIGIPLIILAVWQGGLVLAAMIGILAVLGIIEYDRMLRQLQLNTWPPGMITGVLLFTGLALVPEISLGFLITVVVWLFLFRTILHEGFGFKEAALAILGVFYVGWLMSHLVLLRQLEHGFILVVLVLVATWMTDTMAYFTGMTIGRHKLAPTISPKKTIEGALGGVAGSTLGAYLVSQAATELPLFHLVIMGALVGIIGQAGDLIESSMKRMAGIKDSGNIIPGHGGVLDRFDSLLFTAPLVYYYVQVFIIS